MLTCIRKSQPKHGIAVRGNKPTIKPNVQDVFFIRLLLSALLLCSCAPEVLASGTALSFSCPQNSAGDSCICSETEVDCTGLGLTVAPSGLGANIQRLILKNNAISSIDIIASQSLAQLMYIDASYNTISSLDWSSFSSLTNLEELYLQMNSLYFVDISFFHRNHLHTLYIESASLSSFGAPTSLCNIENLHIGGNTFSTLSADSFACMTNLETLKLNNLGLTSLPDGIFSGNPNLRHIDLSNNQLTNLHTNVFDGIGSLTSLNLAGNPWVCDCDLLWLKIYINDMVSLGGALLNAESTFCTAPGGDNPAFNSLTAYDFLADCKKDHFLARTKRQTSSGGVTTCQVHSTGVQCGSDEVASCVYDFDSQSYSIVHYTSMVTNSSHGNLDESTCREACHLENALYFLFENNAPVLCLCGDVIPVSACSDCDSVMAAGLSGSAQMCNGQYTHLDGAAHILHDLQISISSPSSSSVSTLIAFEEATFEYSGGPRGFDYITWDFGDASTVTVFNRTNVSHTFIYVGSFDVRLTLSATGLSSSSSAASSSTTRSSTPPDVQVTIKVTVTAPLEHGDLSYPVSPVRSLEVMRISAEFKSGWGQTVHWTREDPSAVTSGGEEGEGSCESGWTAFHNRCIRVTLTPADWSTANSQCSSQCSMGCGRLLRVYSLEEITELGADPELFKPGSGTAYYTGAQWSSNTYMWDNSMDKAFVFRETLADSALGNCVQLSTSGLSGVDCSQQLPYICEKDPVTCTVGENYGGQVCYAALSTAATWDEAQANCSSAFANGRLVSSIEDSSFNNFLVRFISGNSWIGLRATTLQGHYTWQDGGSLLPSSYNNWASSTGSEPCVTIDTRGQWHREACDIAKPYICQYFIGDEINVQWKVSGILPRDGSLGAPHNVFQTSPSSIGIGTVTILPGSWFETYGQILQWVVGIKPQASDTDLALQIWRPVCSAGTLDRPGCNTNIPFFTCASSVTQSCNSSICSEGEYYCLLSKSCLAFAQPCTCAGVSSVATNLDCISSINNNHLPRYQLIMSWAVQIPAQTTRIQFEPPQGADVQLGDVLGFQAAQPDLVMCETSSNSSWRNTVISENVVSDWFSVGTTQSLKNYDFKEDMLCEVTAVFSNSSQTSSPGESLTYIASTGDYTFSAKQGSNSLDSCRMTVLDDIQGFLWIYPEPYNTTISQGSTSTAAVNVPADAPLDLVVKVLQGKNPMIAWTFDGGSTQSSSFLASYCPTSISQLPESCSYSSSFLSNPYASFRHSFSPSINPVSLTVQATNTLSFAKIRVTFHVYAPITNVEFYHKDCETYFNCKVYLEEGMLQEFHVSASGDVEDIVFYQDGQEILPAATATANHSMTFSHNDDVVLSVNVSNPVSWMVMNLTVHACIRATLGPVSFDESFMKVALGRPVSIVAKATATSGVTIHVTWIIGDANSTFVLPNTQTVVTPTLPFIFHTTGNVSVTVLLTNCFGDNVSDSMVVEVYKTIETVVLEASSNYIPTGQEFELTIRVDNSSTADDYHYGEMSFSVDWGTGSGTPHTFVDSSPLQSLTHHIDVAGTYTVTVTVTSTNDPNNPMSMTLVLNLQDKISHLRLTYDGPKHVSEQITFTAILNSGTDVEYSLEYGNGDLAPFQSSESFTYNYSVANVYKAIVRARNGVSQRSSSLTLYAYDETLLQIIRVRALRYAPVNTTVSVSTEVAAQVPTSLNYTWNFGNGDVQTGVGLNSATTLYSSIGNFLISLEVENATGNLSDVKNNVICIEETISGLSVHYATPIALQMPGAVEYVNFVATVQSGSNMTYEWIVNDEIDVGNYDTLNWTVTQAGTYNVTVSVGNDLDSKQKDMQLVAMEIITGLTINCFNCSKGNFCKSRADIFFQAGKQYGTHENYTWAFSDNSSVYQGNIVLHNFLKAGTYTVDLVSMNEVSTAIESAIIHAQEEVTGLALLVNQTTTIVDRGLRFQVSYSGGTSLNFVWECSNMTVASLSTDVLELSFPLEGYYNCSAVVSNEVSSGAESVLVTVMGLIANISVDHSFISSPTSLKEWYASVDEVYSLNSVISTNFLVSYEWEIQQGGLVLDTYDTSAFNYSFSPVGSFNVSLRAVNDMSSDEVLLTVHSQKPVSGVNINISSPVFTVVGASIALQVALTTGSDVTYEWTSNGMTQQSQTDSAVISFSSTGVFIVQVTAANKIGYETDEVEVNVFEPVSNVAIQLSQANTLPYVSLTSDLQISAPNVSGSDLVFHWEITNSLGTPVFRSNLTSVVYRFASSGSYTIQLNVSNPMSSLSDSTSIEVQGPILNANVDLSNSVVATASVVTISADVNAGATDLTYTWQINGTISGNAQSFAQQFQTVGIYVIALTVENNISSAKSEAILRVLDPVVGLQISDCNIRLAQSPTIINSIISSGTNVTFLWSINSDATSETFPGESLNFTFPNQGLYNVTLTASNDLGLSHISCLMEAHLPIGNVSLDISSPDLNHIFVNLPVTFTASGGNFQFGTFTWDITGQPSNVSTSKVYTTTFTTTGLFNLTLDISNGVSQVSLSLSFTVRDFQCLLPQVRSVGALQRSVLRSQPLELEVAVDPLDCNEYIAVHTWSIYHSPDCSANLNISLKVDLGNATISSPALTIKARMLAVGSYCVEFATGYHYTSVLETVYFTVNVTSSPLHAVIRGGTRRTVAIGSDLCLDGLSSYDPDDLLTSSEIGYTWQCVESNATGGCFSPQTQGRFCHSNFTEGTYRITLDVSASGRVADSEEQIIEVLDVPHFVPTAGVVCVSCLSLGNYRISCSQHVALSASCDNCAQCSPSFSWKVFEGQQEISLDSSQTSTGISSSNLVLPKWGAIKDDWDYTFVVYVSCTNSSVGTASLTLQANRPPSGGTCQISPLQIVPLEDQVTISCPNWFDMDDPNTAILYTIYVDSLDPLTGTNQTYPLYTGTDATQSVYLGPYGADSINLRVIISDEFGASVLGGRSTITFLSPTLTSGQSQTDYLSQQTDSVLSSLTRQASPISLLQYSIALGQQLNAESRLQAITQLAGSGSQQEQRRAAIRDAVTICLTTTVPVTTLADVQQMAYALKLLTDYSVEYLTEDSQVLMMQTLASMLDLLQSTTNTGLDRGDVPTQDILGVLQNVLSAANARVYSVADIWASGRTVSLADFSTDFQALRPEISQAVGGMSFEAISLDEAHRRRVVSNAMPLLENVLIYTLATMMVGETGIELDLSGATIRAYRSYANNIERQSLSNSSQVQMAESMLDCCKSDSDEVLQVMMSHDRNPYTYGDSSSGRASSTMPVQTVSFFEPNGSVISVSELPQNSSIQLYMFSPNVDFAGSSSAISSGRLVESVVYDPFQAVSYKSVSIDAGKSKVWTIPDVVLYANEGIGVHIQLRIQFPANDTDPASTVTSYVGVNYSPDVDNYDQKLILTAARMANSLDHRDYTFFLSNVRSTDVVYVTATNDDTSRSIQLSVGIYFSSCEYFDVASELWSSSGCTVQDESTATVTSCVCNHLTSFGGAGVVSIADIDFADLDNLDLSTNPVVFIALSIVLGLYIITVLICRYLDTLDLRRISRVPLCGRDGPFKYEIAIVTGRQFGSGTTAHIGLKLYGTQNKGEARHVTKPGAFQRGSRDVFLISHAENLGELTKVLVWHDNLGLSPAWFVSHIAVKDLQTGARYTFLINSWLSLEMEDGVVQKTVKVAGEEEMLRHKACFTSILGHSLADIHAWLSVSERPDHSRFTRVQRATVLLTCIYLYMCVNAVWYGAFKSRQELEQDSWHGAYGWEEVVVALTSTLMVVPFLFGLAFVFKRSRCKESMFQEILRPSSAQTLEIEAMCDLYSRDEGSFRTVTPLGDWVPAIDRESTTESLGVPVGLKRTVPMHRFARRGSTDSNMNRVRPPVLGKKELWSRDTIMQSWPDRMPTWIKQVKAQVKGHQRGAGPSSATSQAGGTSAAADNSFASRRSSRSTRTLFSGSKSVDDSDEDLQQRLDEMDAEIARDEERDRKRKISQELRQKRDSMMDLFDSDDEWVNEGLEELQVTAPSKPLPFNPRRDAELVPHGDRRSSKSGSHSSSSVRGAPATSGSASSRRDSSSVVWRDIHRPNIVSASNKSKSSLSDNYGFRRSLSTTTSQGLPLPLHHLTQLTYPPSSDSSCCPLLLPHWCVYLAYAVCIKLCLLAAILVLLYGYRFGSNAALKWVVSLCCSILISILVVEPLR
ncbi:polycystin-1, partial [Plakobranchus ocellatus]